MEGLRAKALFGPQPPLTQDQWSAR